MRGRPGAVSDDLERPVPGFEPVPGSFQITAAPLAGTRADMEAAGAAGEPALDNIPGADHRAGVAAAQPLKRGRGSRPRARVDGIAVPCS